LKSFELKYKSFGENSILIEWPSIIDETILKNILLFKSEIEKKISTNNVYLKSSYNSLLITYPIINNTQNKVLELKKIYQEINFIKKQFFNKWEIPVCYDLSFGSDLGYLEKSLSIDKKEIISLHSKKEYRVYNIGFLPGFLYLGGLDKKIHHPRKKNPKFNIPKGSVGIGGSQTGIYPNESPGGWHIIGNSPINLFDSEQSPPCFIKPGDKVSFISISLKEYGLLKIQVESKLYVFNKTVTND
jgi:inhibitor of KinA|tara:strand:+ start:577 stop:1308 length:732 start_codon:yes stop_codon:yes gene_type:complete